MIVLNLSYLIGMLVLIFDMHSANDDHKLTINQSLMFRLLYVYSKQIDSGQFQIIEYTFPIKKIRV